MKKLLVYFALVFAVVAGTATVLTGVDPQSAIADACTSGNCYNLSCPKRPLNTAAVSAAPGSFTTLAAIRRPSSRVRPAAVRRPGSCSK